MRPFVVTDARDPLDRVIFASDSFLALTGYDRDEVVGVNCRFLQSPDGRVSPGAPRRSISSASAFLLKQKAAERCETEHSIINFKKSGEAFMNHLALVPIPWGAEVGAPRFLFGFVNVFEDSAMLPPTASCQSSLDTPSCLVSGDSSFSSGQNTATLSTSRGPGFSISAVDQDDNTATQGVEPMEWSPSQDNLEQHSDDGVVPTDPLPDLIPCLQGLENISSTTSTTPAWNQMLLENVDALVQVLSLKGNIAYASASHERLGYGAGDLLGKPMDRLYHPSDVAVLMRELKNIGTSDLDLTVRLKWQSGEYAWFQSTGSVRHDGGRRWVTLTLFQQPVSRLGSRALRGDGRATSKHGLWFKLATSGLVLHLFDNPQKALGIPAEDLVGTRLQDALIQQSEARAEFDKLLRAAPRGRGVVDAHAHQRAGPPSGGEHRPTPRSPGRPPAAVLSPGVLRDLRPHARRRKGPPSGNDNNSNNKGEEEEEDAGDDVLETLDANRCGSLGFEIHRLGAANQGLHEELQGLLKRASQRRRFKKHGIGAGGCVNCHTTLSPEWRRGPGGERNLCNRCGLRWAKTRREAEADADADTVDQASNPSRGSQATAEVAGT
ncbi:WC-1 [Apiospora hydei]|uniref:WC-1 n=1 Tax=Apiospora hydei TaxID=1337664 RepID=A0ABR1UVR2_9PEZI